MEQYKFDLDNSEQNRIVLAEKTISIGEKQPLMSTYSDAQAFNSLIGISADKIPNRLNRSLYNSTHYLPHSIVGIYYLIKQCDGMGRWSVDNWLYYDQLNNYYKNMLPTYSILLSMTISCDQVYDIVNQECKDYFKQKGKSPVCSIDQSISKLN